MVTNNFDSLIQKMKQVNLERVNASGKARETLGFIEKIAPVNKLNSKICAIDSGIIVNEYSAFDLIVYKVVGVMFEYNDSKLINYGYYPSKIVDLEFDTLIGYERLETGAYKTLKRLQIEINCAIECAEKFNPDIIFLDGSVLPLPSDKPSSSSKLKPFYDELINDYLKLYRICEEKNIELAGVIKDSRAKRLLSIMNLDKQLFGNDITFTDNFLLQGERVKLLDYSLEPDQDLLPYSAKVKFSYLKPVANDMPLRVELLCNDSNYVTGVICELSKINKNYAYPAILIEVDLRAAIDPVEVDNITTRLSSNLGIKGSRKLKRNVRPFR